MEDTERKPLIKPHVSDDEMGAAEETQTTASSVGPDELPPPYQQDLQGGGPVVTCRVCQAMIDISWKREQHVVKCLQCNEATVSDLFTLLSHSNMIMMLFSYLLLSTANSQCSTGQEVCSLSLQLSFNL